MVRKPQTDIALAACLQELNPSTPSEIQLFPSGRFKAKDGRPGRLPGVGTDSWLINDTIAGRVIAKANAQIDKFAADYEHQTLLSAKNGQPAPASGWFKKLEWREGVGLFAVDVEWTPAAAAKIEAREYRYVSPVFEFDKRTGEVLEIKMAALVNVAAIDGMKDLAAAAADLFLTQQAEIGMDQLLELLRQKLGLAADAGEAAIMAALEKMQPVAEMESAVAAAKAGLESAKAQAADPAKFVPIDVVKGLQTEMAALKTEQVGKEVDGLITEALACGKLLKPQESWARELGKTNIVALKEFIAVAAPIPGLSGSQTQGKEPEGGGRSGLSAVELAVCKATGISEDEYLKQRG